MHHTSMGWWIGFGIFVLAMLAIDLGVFHRKAHRVNFREAAVWAAIWVAMALVFNLGLYLGWFAEFPPADRPRIALEFLTAFLIEKALSVDNIFVFAVIFRYFNVPNEYQHKVLFYGILGALVFRLVFILLGIELIKHFHWTMYLFGGLLVLTGFRLMFKHGEAVDPAKNPIMKLAVRFLPVRHEFQRDHFFVRQAGRLVATPMFLVLLLVETTDVVFAVDSIPAVFGISQEAFIVYTSNVFAILGLRALYFVLASVMDMFHYLGTGLAVLLIVIGLKMIGQEAELFHLRVGWSLGLVAAILSVSVAASLIFPKHDNDDDDDATGGPPTNGN